MNWEAIGAIGEVLGAIGVIVTLVYFSLQIRRFSQQMRIQNVRGQASEEQQIAVFQSSPQILEVLEKCYHRNEIDLSFREMTLMEAYFEVKMAMVRADYKLFAEGLLDEAEWLARKEQFAMLLVPSWMKSYWKVLKRFEYPSMVRDVDLHIESSKAMQLFTHRNSP